LIRAIDRTGISMKRLALAASILAVSAIAAAAADPNTKPPIKAAEVFNWTGFYIGGNVGGSWENESGNSNFVSPSAPAAQASTPQANALSDTAVIGGVHAGYNLQMTRWVIGVEADWDWTHTKTGFCRQTDNLSAPCTDNGRGYLTLNQTTQWLDSARGRLGYAWDRVMVYGTGGAAWGRIDSSITANCLVAGCGSNLASQITTVNFSDTKVGWVAGAGIEGALDNDWIARAEYLHYDLGSVTSTLTAVPQSTTTWSRASTFETVRFGLSYKFGGAASTGY
jgi:outer membrane immunogenic protein